MYSTTGLAVGMAIGVPTFAFIVVFVVFWYRQQLKYKKDLRQHNGIDDYDEVNDLDLDHMIDTPKESHVKDFSNDELVREGSNDREEQTASAEKHASTALRGEGVLIKNGSYSIRKESKIMGLRIIPKDRNNNNNNNKTNANGNANTNGVKSNITGSDNNNSGIAPKTNTIYNSRQHSDLENDNNFKVYYESVIPVLPGSSLDNRTSVSTDGHDGNKVNSPNTPMKIGNSLGRNSNHSSVEFYKMLQEDSPFYPRSRVTSGIIGETPLRRSNVPGSPANGTRAHSSSDQLFHSPNHSTTAEVSPFDTPPARTKIGERLERDDSTTIFDHPTESTAHDTDHVKDSNTNLFEHTINSINESEGDDESQSNSALESSPLRKNVHRRINSAESRIILDNNSSAAEDSYNMKRKEWLDMYRKK